MKDRLFSIAIVLCLFLTSLARVEARPARPREKSVCDSLCRTLSRGPSFAPPRIPAQTISPRPPAPKAPKNAGFVHFVNAVGQLFLADTTQKRKISFLALPEISYGERDGIGLGITARMYINDFRPRPQGWNKRQSYVDFSGNFTFKGDLSLSVRPTLYLLQDRMLIRGYFGLGHYPSTFRVNGPDSGENEKEDYDKNLTRVRMATYWRWLPHIYVGVGFHYYDYGVSDKVPGGILEQGTITGSNGTKISGLSLHYLRDTRDHQFVPLKGLFTQVDAYFNGRFLGSSEDYTKYIVDLRYYLPVGREQLIALNFYSQIAVGDVPFQDMAELSDGIHGRGYGSGRYTDKNMMALQAEYRYYFGRFGLSAFISTGNVGDTALKALKMNKPTFGGGLRFKPFRHQRMYFRADAGTNTHGDLQFYLGIDELF